MNDYDRTKIQSLKTVKTIRWMSSEIRTELEEFEKWKVTNLLVKLMGFKF